MSIASVSPMPHVANVARTAEAHETPGQPDRDGDSDDKGGVAFVAAPVQSAKAAGVGTAVDRTA